MACRAFMALPYSVWSIVYLIQGFAEPPADERECSTLFYMDMLSWTSDYEKDIYSERMGASGFGDIFKESSRFAC